jgi:methylmalonyl-CoA/ethylmalonyl-CoA epimerase
MNLKLDHIAIAVADIKTAVEAFERKLGLPCHKVEDVPAQDAVVAFFDLGGAHLELVAPLSESSSLTRSIQKRGEGLHHLCFEVPSLDTAVADLEAKGVQIASPPKPGANDTRVAFVHPKSMNGVLVELVEKPVGT